MKKNLIVGIIAFLGLYLFSTGVAFAVFTFVLPSTLELISPGGNVDEKVATETEGQKDSKFKMLLDVSGPKTEACPLNGALYTENEKNAWEKRRPLAVMIENHEEARPQSGLSSADIVYETVAEGGITRFMAIYYCDAQSHEIIVGPVRSARTFYLDWLSEYGNNPLYAHVGGANCNRETGSGCANGAKADALGQIEKYGWGGITGNDLNQFAIGYPTYWRDYERIGHTVATEHTVYSTTERLWQVGAKRGWTNEDEDGVAWDEDYVSWKFADGEKVEGGNTNEVVYDFWSNSPAGDFSVKWTYDPTKLLYMRTQGTAPHMDLNTEEQLSVSNVIVMYSVESKANDDYPGNIHLLYGLIGKGNGYLFQKGNVEEITWEKKSRTDRTRYYLKSSKKEVEFIPGKIWISNLPVGAAAPSY